MGRPQLTRYRKGQGPYGYRQAVTGGRAEKRMAAVYGPPLAVVWNTIIIKGKIRKK
jgi:hypothetical protein